MDRKPSSFRLGIEHHSFIAKEMEAGNVKASEAARRLITRGAAMPEPVYLKATITCKEELDQFADTHERIRRLWLDIGSVVRAQLPENADKEKIELVTTGRACAKELLELALPLGSTARHLAKKMMGIGPAELADLHHTKKVISAQLALWRALPDGHNQRRPETLRGMQRVLDVLSGLGI